MSELNKDDELVISLNSSLFREKFYLSLGLHYISPKPGKSPGLTIDQASQGPIPEYCPKPEPDPVLHSKTVPTLEISNSINSTETKALCQRIAATNRSPINMIALKHLAPLELERA